MHFILVYDIPSNRLRKKVFETCKDYGLHHLQLSAFTGNLNNDRLKSLEDEMLHLINRREGSVVIFPACNKCCEKKVYIKDGKLTPPDIIEDEKSIIFV